MSIARQHFQRTLAEQQATEAQAKGETVASGSESEQMMVLLRSHEIALKAIQSIATKIDMKKGFMGEYGDYIEAQLAADTGLQDDVLTTLLVWSLDAGDLNGALVLAEYALRHDLKMPARFNRKLPVIVVEDVANHILDNLAETDSDQHAQQLGALKEALDLTDGKDMPDEVRAKAFKALGHLTAQTAPQTAVESYEAALKLNPKIGVKGALDRLKRSLKEAADKTK